MGPHNHVLHGGPHPALFCGWQTLAFPGMPTVGYKGAWIFGATMRPFVKLLSPLVFVYILTVAQICVAEAGLPFHCDVVNCYFCFRAHVLSLVRADTVCCLRTFSAIPSVYTMSHKAPSRYFSLARSKTIDKIMFGI